jgi:hypothetical protein
MTFRFPDILSVFLVDGPVARITPAGSGHINDSFLVTMTAEDSPDYFLQRINHSVFKNIPGLSDNILKVSRHLEARLKEPAAAATGFRVIRPTSTRDGSYYHRDPEGNYWRLYNHISGSRSYDILVSPAQAFEAGYAFGMFQHLTSDLDASTLIETIPNFHHLGSRLEAFRQAVRLDPAGRRKEVMDLIGFAEDRAEEMSRIQTLIGEKRIPLRVTHNDTKCNNVLFNSGDKAICIVDLDTVMPGTILFDFGDAIRTGASTAAEDEQDLEKVHLDLGLFEAYAEGYLSVARNFLVPGETANLAFSARFMTYLIGLRFLTDFLDGDHYYRTAYETHNLVRARVQFRLVERMEQSAVRMEQIIQTHC